MSYSMKCASFLIALGLVAAGAWAVQPADDPGAGIAQAMPPGHVSERAELLQAVVSLPIAAALGAALAFRPQRRGTPPRDPAVIQTQIILALVGALVMLVVGASLARAFGIVGAAGLVRYRAKIDDPKDAGVMLSTLAVGLAAGVGVWLLAGFATIFILALLWVVESMEPKATELYTLTVKAKDPAGVKPKLDALLARYRLRFELRTTSKEELIYEVRTPVGGKTDRLSDRIQKIDPENISEVAWEDKKEKK
jgi:uncharacterized membrane protein YhiD involved in acid resistance